MGKISAENLIRATQAAKMAGVRLATYTSYVSRGQAPQAVVTLDGVRYYDRDQIAAWVANRPGRGARTDLVKS